MKTGDMKIRLTLLAAAFAVTATCAAESYDAEYGTFDLDARANSFSVGTAADVAGMLPVTFGIDETGTVTAVNPNTGASASYTKDEWYAAFADGRFNPGEGGAWHLSIDAAAPSWERTASFDVKYSLYRTVAGGRPRHAGTGGDPEVLYYAGELGEYGADGFVFTLADGVAMPSLPAGLELLDLGGGVYMLYAAGSLGLYSSYAVDTRQDSTNRVVRYTDELPPVAYTADGWAGESAAAVSLRFTSPKGVETVENLTGTGGVDFTPCSGLWRVTMTAGGESEYATILFLPVGISLSFF